MCVVCHAIVLLIFPLLILHSIQCIRLSGLENGLLGVSSKVNAVVWAEDTVDVNNLDIICFGHLLYEMCTGFELTCPQPSSEKIRLDLDRFPQVKHLNYLSVYLYKWTANYNSHAIGTGNELELFDDHKFTIMDKYVFFAMELRSLRCFKWYFSRRIIDILQWRSLSWAISSGILIYVNWEDHPFQYVRFNIGTFFSTGHNTRYLLEFLIILCFPSSRSNMVWVYRRWICWMQSDGDKVYRWVDRTVKEAHRVHHHQLPSESGNWNSIFRW